MDVKTSVKISLIQPKNLKKHIGDKLILENYPKTRNFIFNELFGRDIICDDDLKMLFLLYDYHKDSLGFERRGLRLSNEQMRAYNRLLEILSNITADNIIKRNERICDIITYVINDGIGRRWYLKKNCT